jgi:hypothetical protein
MMFHSTLLLLALFQTPDTRSYELRVYHPTPGKQAATNAIIAGLGCKYMAKHQIQVVGAWVPTDKTDERVFVLVSHADKATAMKNWEALAADDGFKSELAEASKDGKAVASISRFFLTATDYSPAIKPTTPGQRVFELRTYITPADRLKHLNSRFRDHTVKLFEKHGITNLGYFTLGAEEKTTVGDVMKALTAKGKDQVDADKEAVASPVTLVYFVSHPSVEAMGKNFGAFGKDEAWRKAMSNSEKVAGGSLTARNGVKSLLLVPTEYSPWK